MLAGGMAEFILLSYLSAELAMCSLVSLPAANLLADADQLFIS